MKIFNKQTDKDFIILNLTDTQLSNEEWDDGHKHRKILEYTITELVHRIKPNLITITGDLAWAGHDQAYEMLAEFINKFGIPWAPVWGNHDNQNGPEYIDSLATRYMAYSNCVYEKGDPTLGNGNYILLINEGGKPVEAIFMVDSHDREPYTNDQGENSPVWAKLTEAQAAWFKEQSQTLRNAGYKDATIFLHIPIYAYREASRAAYKSDLNLKEVTPEEANTDYCWNEGYTDSIGVQYESIGSYPDDDGMLQVIKDTEIVKHIIAGHEHINNWIIRYNGIRMVYALKTGAGCYWDTRLNGGTVININSSGVSDIHHEFVDVSHIVD